MKLCKRIWMKSETKSIQTNRVGVCVSHVIGYFAHLVQVSLRKVTASALKIITLVYWISIF